MIKEQFLPINGYEGLYEVSNLGNVKSLRKGRILKTYRNNITGYFMVSLSKNGKQETKLVHRLVLETFIPNPDSSIYTDCDHIDEDKSNNTINNLQWITHKGNLNRGTYNKRMSESLKKHYSEFEASHGKSIQQFDRDGKLIAIYNSITKAAKSIGKDFNSFRVSIRRVLNGSSKKGLAYGFIWRYN